MHSSLRTTDVTSPGGSYGPVAKDPRFLAWVGGVFPGSEEHGGSTDRKVACGDPTSGLVSLSICGAGQSGDVQMAVGDMGLKLRRQSWAVCLPSPRRRFGKRWA